MGKGDFPSIPSIATLPSNARRDSPVYGKLAGSDVHRHCPGGGGFVDDDASFRLQPRNHAPRSGRPTLAGARGRMVEDVHILPTTTVPSIHWPGSFHADREARRRGLVHWQDYVLSPGPSSGVCPRFQNCLKTVIRVLLRGCPDSTTSSHNIASTASRYITSAGPADWILLFHTRHKISAEYPLDISPGNFWQASHPCTVLLGP